MRERITILEPAIVCVLLAAGLCAATRLGAAQEAEGAPAEALRYAVVDTAQDRCFSDRKEIAYPKAGEAFFGQDAEYQGPAPAYRDNGDGTVTDRVTDLVWVKTPDLENKKTFAEASAGAQTCRVGGYRDWRLPTIKELYSLIEFNGTSDRTASTSKPYIDTRYFAFAYGDEKRGERLIDAQYWSSTEYVGTTMRNDAAVFGVNFADGRIKGYPARVRDRPGAHRQFVRYVRGNPGYGVNDFADNGDGTVTDRATGLEWTKADSGRAMTWADALAYAEGLKLAGHEDWRLPNAKELQSIVDYSRAPDAKAPAKRGPAIDPVFDVTNTESWYWTGTSHLEHGTCGSAVYVCFGRAFGTMQGVRMNVHGAGAQRSDPKSGDPAVWKSGRGPQGDEVRILNYVRCVRGGKVTLKTEGPAVEGRFRGGDPSADDGGPGGPGPGRGESFVGRLDRNGDGKVSRSEFDGPPEHFDALDRNRDGYLEEEEAPRGPPPSGRPGRMGGKR